MWIECNDSLFALHSFVIRIVFLLTKWNWRNRYELIRNRLLWITISLANRVCFRAHSFSFLPSISIDLSFFLSRPHLFALLLTSSLLFYFALLLLPSSLFRSLSLILLTSSLFYSFALLLLISSLLAPSHLFYLQNQYNNYDNSRRALGKCVMISSQIFRFPRHFRANENRLWNDLI